MNTTHVYEDFRSAVNSFFKGFDLILNKEKDRDQPDPNKLYFKVFDFEFVIKSEIDPFKELAIIKTYRITENESSDLSKDLHRKYDLEITVKNEKVSMAILPCARFNELSENDLCYCFKDNAALGLRYKELLESYLKK